MMIVFYWFIQQRRSDARYKDDDDDVDVKAMIMIVGILSDKVSDDDNCRNENNHMIEFDVGAQLMTMNFF